MQKLIITADDFGLSEENNKAIFSGVKDGLINATGIIANMPGFDNAVKEILPKININLGVHFNIFEGKSLTNCPLLTDSNGYFNKSFIQILSSQNNENLMRQIETELKAQIEKVLNFHKVSRLDSHCHYHSIPKIFDIFVKAAEEYEIKYIRTWNEPFYIVPSKILNKRFPLNVVKHILLKRLNEINKIKLEKSGLNTNDNLIGVLYTGYTDENSILSALKHIKGEITEVIFHPYLPKNLENTNRLNNYKEFLITKNPRFKQELKNQGFEPACFV